MVLTQKKTSGEINITMRIDCLVLVSCIKYRSARTGGAGALPIFPNLEICSIPCEYPGRVKTN